MRDFKKRVRSIEEKTGLSGRNNYMFIHICHPEGFLSKEELKGKGFYENEDFRGAVVIIKQCGKKSLAIDTSSEEGRKILIDNGYQKID